MLYIAALEQHFMEVEYCTIYSPSLGVVVTFGVYEA
jgi:hypothetical protein